MASARSCRRRYRRWIEREFEGALGRRRRDRLRAHLEACEPCRILYDRLARADELLGSEDGLSLRSLERIQDAVVAGGRGGDRSRRRWAWAAGGAVASVAAVILLVVSSSTTGELPGELTPRSGHALELFEDQRKPGLRIFCVESAEVTGEARLVEDGTERPTLHCGMNGELHFAYTSPEKTSLFMVVGFRGSSGDLQSALAGSVADAPVRLEADAIDRVLDAGRSLRTMRPGRHVVEARFYPAVSSLQQALAADARPVYTVRAVLEVESQ